MERHFQEQAIVQSDLKRQLLEQSKLQQEVIIISLTWHCHVNLLQAQRQSVSFAEAQSRQSRLLEDAQRQVSSCRDWIVTELVAQVQEQADKLRVAELKLKEAEFMSKEKAMQSDR